MAENKLQKQIEAVNRAFHQVWFFVLFNRPDFKSESMHKLSFVDMHLISLAYEHPDMILKEIREYLKVPQTTLSSIVAKLEKQGYIRRVINRRDMRSFSIEVTEKGKEIREAHKRHDLEMAKQILIILDEHEREAFIQLFQKVANGISSAIK